MAAAEVLALAAAQVGRSAPSLAVLTGKTRRSGSRSKWQKHPSPPLLLGETPRRKAAQQASVGAGAGRARGATTATCDRHGATDTMAAAHGVAGGTSENAPAADADAAAATTTPPRAVPTPPRRQEDGDVRHHHCRHVRPLAPLGRRGCRRNVGVLARSTPASPPRLLRPPHARRRRLATAAPEREGKREMSMTGGARIRGILVRTKMKIELNHF
uniref:Uncharacterized protein n=1 Tax=Oryza sativa subsp. japonica TaxID=39947 RepID=Q6ZC04_ORYSJ|nr:hypothetical protein [Oryza sativa Japonica Group]